jgi:shikimate kinase
MIISLTGFMGCGKSSVGKELSALLSCSYADLDTIIEKAAGHSIPEIFANEGEPVFRQMELEALRRVLADSEMDNKVSDLPSDTSMILALGGGAVMTPECAGLVREKTLCVYLRTSIETIAGRLAAKGEAEGRPMLKSGPGIAELMDRRKSTYESTAHMIVDTDGKSISEVAEEIAEYCVRLRSSHPFRACP